ncbi:MAG: hypothetical protein KDD53_09565 [Bdellovibrionales bacterium]|nr:hypothetical protein [Bdellovibrionales bacterium]
MPKLDHVDYDALDSAKSAFIEASRRTLNFASQFGFVPDERLGASANIFSLDLTGFLSSGSKEILVTLLPEGLGTADDARPEHLTGEEAVRFWHNIGIKSVAVMTNDAASSGMQPILISLYLPSASPEHVFTKEFMTGFLDGFVSGCRTVGCVYISGETPQLKSKMFEDKLDIAGAVFGIIPAGQQAILSGELSAGDSIVFVESSGPHENGYTSLRKLAESLPNRYRTKLPSGKQYFEAINAPSILYTPYIQKLLKSGIRPSNVEPITGHGWQKIMRSHKPLSYVIDSPLPVPEIFSFVEQASNTSRKRMLEIFNYGVGLAVFFPSSDLAQDAVNTAKELGLNAIVAGRVEHSAKRQVIVKPWDIILKEEGFTLNK